MQTSAERFNTISENFTKSEVHRLSPSMTRFSELIGAARDLTIGDVACGPGHFGFSLVDHAARIVGIDPSPNMLKQFRDLGSKFAIPLEDRIGTAEDLPAADGEFDLTISRLAPHHFSDVRKAIAQMTRVTKKGGIVGIIDLQGCENARCDTILHVLEMLHDPTHVRAYTASQWHEILSNSGLKIEHLENGLSEKPGGITIQRWCEIASSGPVAEAAIDEFLRICGSSELAQLGIECREGIFYYPVRSLLALARRK